ncbi:MULTISPECIES: SulP family inorganic anion transporter [unclassified Bradyrhizobium]|uniref:SulP family inorganic anion transporter n=1 Tax=Bradyrhizobium sp. USDA 4541 TaxID=2817704 RepID=UPI0011450604|nr:SulP family inorganic anion transporter [Bradyrhizobium sp. USDA 4541]MCP1850531.1 high affinity sulfate transporter 1 [Bradyrhizobium sp. USDA 4541]MCP1914461.1 high affinity sulfate transporter 1 [Bradyrhizobium elkanii]
MMDRLTRIAPGLIKLLSYRFAEDFRHDLLAGVSVAAVALPVAIAYAQLAGFNPVVGLYSSILPLVAYAIFGTSRQMIVNPDAAGCAMVAAAVAPLAGGNSELYWSLAVAVTFLAGIFCIAASFFRLGALAEFLSKPILVGLLNGVAISICLGQVGKLLGFSIESKRIIPQLFEIFTKLPQTQVPTLIVGAASLAILLGLARWAPRLPTAPLILIAAGAAVALFGLDRYGVAILGPVPGGAPPLRLPRFPQDDIPSLLGSAAGLALVLFSSGMLTARSFASKGGYNVDADRELAAFGAANLASALSQGFAVTGADSRTAVAAAAGGRTQVTGLVAAVTITAVLLFLTGPLRYVPIAALGALLVFASISLFDTRTLREIWSIDRTEVGLAVITTLGVVALGAINGILIAVGLALVRFVKLTARPRDEVLGTVDGLPGLHSIDRHPDARTFPGLVLYRFDGPLTFFNSDYFKTRALAAAEAAGPELRWFVIDAIPVSQIDINGLYALRDLRERLEARGASLILAGRKAEFLDWFREAGLYRPEHETWIFPTLRQALKGYRQAEQRVAPLKQDDL